MRGVNCKRHVNVGVTLRIAVPWELVDALRPTELNHLARTSLMRNGDQPNTKIYEGRLEPGVAIEQIRDLLNGRIQDYFGPTGLVHPATIGPAS